MSMAQALCTDFGKNMLNNHGTTAEAKESAITEY